MAKFIPSEQVETLEFDFTDYGGTEGVIHEPTTGDVNTFFKNMKGLMKGVKALQASAKNLERVGSEDMSDEELAASISEVDEIESQTTDFQIKTIENLSQLCGAKWEGEEGFKTLVGGSPTFAELQLLPYRVLQAFTTWLMEAIKPKRTTPGSPN